MTHRFEDEEAIFAGALERETPGERSAFLAGACHGDESLRARVEALLKSHEGAAGFLKPAEPAASKTTDTLVGATEAPGMSVGPYKLLQKLGEGGMGSVWAAEQTEPVKRRVAIKLIKPGMDSAQVLRRFEAERQALALMEHTHIAKVLDAGTTPEGRPYFVMELVKGVPITKYCDELRLPLRERLALFLPICQAIQHAHTKGIIHRDIKPSNVLVAMQDGKPVPKVIDFGVAKALHQKLTEGSIFTEIGQIVGTLEYMSPEQAELSALDIDTRTDVYALGVLLYELLTGTTPLDRKRLGQAAYVEMLRMIREVEPPKPSTRLFDSKESIASLAAQRRTEPARLTKAVRGELDWIVMKALEKDRTRRYETANGLARDIERHLNDEPIEASPPSWTYRTGKILRRYKHPIVAALLGIFTLVVGIVRANIAWKAEAEQRVIAEQHEREATEAERLALEREQEAKKARDETKQVLDYLVASFRRPDPDADGEKLTVAELFDQATLQMDESFPNQPLIQARLLKAIGRTYGGLGLYQKAVVVLERARELRRNELGENHEDTLASMGDLAGAYEDVGRLAEALQLHVETLERKKAKLGAEHLETLTSMNNLALAYLSAGRTTEALPLLEKTLEKRKAKLGAEHPDTLTSMNNLASAYQAAGRLEDALPLLEQTLRLRKATLGAEHPQTLASMNNLASAYRAGGRLEDALPLFEQTLELIMDKLGPEHPDTLNSIHNLASAYVQAGRAEDAIPLFEETMNLKKVKLGPIHPKTIASMNNLAQAHKSAGNLEQALTLLEQTRELANATFGPKHPNTLDTIGNLAQTYLWSNRPEKALPLFDQFIGGQRGRTTPDAPMLAGLLASVSLDLLQHRQYPAAETYLRECLTIRKKKSPDHWVLFYTKSLLGDALAGQEKFQEAEPLLVEGYSGMKDRESKTPEFSIRLSEAIRRLVEFYMATGQAEKADEWRTKLDAAHPEEPKTKP